LSVLFRISFRYNTITMRVITGDECGRLKEVLPLKNVIHSIPSNVSRSLGITSLAWVKRNSYDQYASLHLNGTVSFWDGHQKIASLDNVFNHQTYAAALRALGLTRVDNARLCACDMQGTVSVIANASDDKQIQKQPAAVIHSFSAATTAKSQDTALFSAMTTNANRVALGGNERETVLMDLQTQQQVWKAKNIPPDPQTLLHAQVWPTSILFLSDSNITTSISATDSTATLNTLAVGTAHAQVRLYDIRAQRRPTHIKHLEGRITALCQLNGHTLIAADAAGTILEWDLRAPDTAVAQRYVGPAGSIRSLQTHPTLSKFVAVGLDRMVRVFDTTNKNNGKQQQACVYLKQRLNAVLVADTIDWEESVNIEQADHVEDYVDSENDDGTSHIDADNDESDDESSDDEDDSGDDDDEHELVEHMSKRQQSMKRQKR
jgi:ribosome biogenesis protein NSA1